MKLNNLDILNGFNELHKKRREEREQSRYRICINCKYYDLQNVTCKKFNEKQEWVSSCFEFDSKGEK